MYLLYPKNSYKIRKISKKYILVITIHRNFVRRGNLLPQKSLLFICKTWFTEISECTSCLLFYHTSFLIMSTSPEKRIWKTWHLKNYRTHSDLNIYRRYWRLLIIWKTIFDFIKSTIVCNVTKESLTDIITDLICDSFRRDTDVFGTTDETNDTDKHSNKTKKTTTAIISLIAHSNSQYHHLMKRTSISFAFFQQLVPEITAETHR